MKCESLKMMINKKCRTLLMLIAFLLILICDSSQSLSVVQRNTPQTTVSLPNTENKSALHSATVSPVIKTNDHADEDVADYPADTAAAASDDVNYVLEDMDLLQNDQPPNRRSYLYGGVRKHPPIDRREQQQQHFATPSHRDDNVQYTKEMHVRQGAIKGIVRTMHAQSGLNNVDQYLGIPYAASPTGSGRFMPPGKCCDA